MVAYLFNEVARNFRLIHDPADWIRWVSLSQRGDRSVEIDPAHLPTRDEMMAKLPSDRPDSGIDRMEAWLDRADAHPFDFNKGLDDDSLSADEPPDFVTLPGGNFFRGLALIDLAEAMLKRAFGDDSVAVRVNAAGQGNYFQVHVDTHRVSTEEVKEFLRVAFYRRFGLSPEQEFVELHPGGDAVGARLERFDQIPEVVRLLREGVGQTQIDPA